MQHIRIQDVSIFSITLRACFACILVQLKLRIAENSGYPFLCTTLSKFYVKNSNFLIYFSASKLGNELENDQYDQDIIRSESLTQND